jgi:hypothetical protein
MLTSTIIKDTSGMRKYEQGPIDKLPKVERPKRLGLVANIVTPYTKKINLQSTFVPLG